MPPVRPEKDPKDDADPEDAKGASPRPPRPDPAPVERPAGGGSDASDIRILLDFGSGFEDGTDDPPVIPVPRPSARLRSPEEAEEAEEAGEERSLADSDPGDPDAPIVIIPDELADQMDVEQSLDEAADRGEDEVCIIVNDDEAAAVDQIIRESQRLQRVEAEMKAAGIEPPDRLLREAERLQRVEAELKEAGFRARAAEAPPAGAEEAPAPEAAPAPPAAAEPAAVPVERGKKRPRPAGVAGEAPVPLGSAMARRLAAIDAALGGGSRAAGGAGAAPPAPAVAPRRGLLLARGLAAGVLVVFGLVFVGRFIGRGASSGAVSPTPEDVAASAPPPETAPAWWTYAPPPTPPPPTTQEPEPRPASDPAAEALSALERRVEARAREGLARAAGSAGEREVPP